MLDTGRMLTLVAYVATRVAKVNEYKSWSDEFARKDVEEAFRAFTVALMKEKISWESLTVDEMKALRFIAFDKPNDAGEVLMLVPLYVLRALPEGTILRCIDGKTAVVGQDTIDNDTRQGCVGYGFTVKVA